MTIRDMPSPQPSSRDGRYHTTRTPSAEEGADRCRLKNLCLD
jgi:hypothetical protein